MADLQQLTTLQFCLIDNCTIIRNDTGQQLDIVYTTQSHLVVTSTDGQTSTMLISKNDPELLCSTTNTTDDFAIVQAIGLVVLTLITFTSGYIVVVHMMFKKLRSTFGKLMLYNIAKICQSFTGFALSITHHNVPLHSVMPCYDFNFLYIQSVVVGETFATCILAYLAYLMRESSKIREVKKENKKQFCKHSTQYVLGLLLLFDIFIVSYDFGTGTYKYTLLPDGHCSYFVQTQYNTLRILDTYSYINEIIQIFLLVVYFYYYYKLNKMLEMFRHIENKGADMDPLFFKMAIMMVASLGISQILLTSSWYFDNELLLNMVGVLFFIHQCVIASFFTCSKKVSRLCKERFATTVTSS